MDIIQLQIAIMVKGSIEKEVFDSLTLFAIFVDSLIQYYTGFNILGFEILHPNRISSFFYDGIWYQ